MRISALKLILSTRWQMCFVELAAWVHFHQTATVWKEHSSTCSLFLGFWESHYVPGTSEPKCEHTKAKPTGGNENYSPVWTPECYKWSRECWADDSQCTHNLKENIKSALAWRCFTLPKPFVLWCSQAQSEIIWSVVPSAEKTFFFFFSHWVKFKWNASNRIKDFWSTTRLLFQSKHYAQGELCHCSTPFIQSECNTGVNPEHPPPPL